ncbi:MAG: 50S ribosomal protein L21 [Candidatus Methylacidiphilales bacterium]|nr:50S ribosomal protein L21 [Candidatus Methylacidiphilales bacterium]
MFAVIRTGSKQYKVSEGDLIDVELLAGAEPGKSTTFNDVLLIADGASVNVGKPTVSGASVTGEVLGEVKGDKVIAFKYRRTEGYHRTVGHRQRYLRVKIAKIKS